MEISTAPALVRELPSWLLSQGALQARYVVGRHLGDLGARRSDFSMLAALDEFGPTSQADLGRRIGLDRSDVAAAVATLASDGLVDRAPDPADGRRNVVSITPPGQVRLADLTRAVHEAQDELLAGLDATDRAELTRLLTALVQAVGALSTP